MFEDATFDARGLAATHLQRWVLLTLTMNCAAAAAMILIPLLSPQKLPSLLFRDVIYTPPERKAVITEARHESASRAATVPVTADNTIRRTPVGTQREASDTEPPMETLAWNRGLDDPAAQGKGLPTGVFSRGTPTVVKADDRTASVKVSKGVTEGLLLHRVQPTYPRMAVNAQVAGTVSLAATISKEGRIENLQVLSGPAMLRKAAVDAVKQWRYQPYLLNGEAVEVETTIDIHFTLTQ